MELDRFVFVSDFDVVIFGVGFGGYVVVICVL